MIYLIEMKNVLFWIYNNVLVNVDNLLEFKLLNLMNENGNMKDVNENFGNGDLLELYKRRKFVLNGLKGNGIIFEDGFLDKKFNLLEIMGLGDFIFLYNLDDYFELK